MPASLRLELIKTILTESKVVITHAMLFLPLEEITKFVAAPVSYEARLYHQNRGVVSTRMTQAVRDRVAAHLTGTTAGGEIDNPIDVDDDEPVLQYTGLPGGGAAVQGPAGD
jgi:hypothetical protein